MELRLIQSNFFFYSVVFLLVLQAAVFVALAGFSYQWFSADISKIALETLANQARIQADLQPLAENPQLEKAAQMKAQDMVAQGYFQHTSPTGITPWFWFSKAGYNYKYAGENLAIGFFESQDVFNAWLDSPTHKANILNSNYKEVGTAVLSGFGQNGAIVVVQEFGSKMPAKAVVTKPSPTPFPAVEAQKPIQVGQPKVLSQNAVQSPQFVVYRYGQMFSGMLFITSMILSGSLLLAAFIKY